MTRQLPTTPKLPFAYSTESEKLDAEITKLVGDRAMALRHDFVSPSNVYRMKHGRKWQTMHSSHPEESAEILMHSIETSVSHQDVVDHRVEQLPKHISEITSKIHEQFVAMMVGMLDETTQRSGNVVLGRGRPFAESLEEMLAKIAFGVDRYGRPTAPHVFVPPGVVRSLDEIIGTLDESQKSRLSIILENKRNDALAEEVRRISRYRIVR